MPGRLRDSLSPFSETCVDFQWLRQNQRPVKACIACCDNPLDCIHRCGNALRETRVEIRKQVRPVCDQTCNLSESNAPIPQISNCRVVHYKRHDQQRFRDGQSLRVREHCQHGCRTNTCIVVPRPASSHCQPNPYASRYARCPRGGRVRHCSIGYQARYRSI